MIDTKVADITSALPGEASLQRFFDQFERRFRNVQLKAESFRGQLEFARFASDARRVIALTIPALAGSLLLAYGALLGKTDPASELFREMVPFIGSLMCAVMMAVGNSRYEEECAHIAAALRTERQEGIEDGVAATRAAVLGYGNWWMPSRDHLSGFCTNLVFVGLFIAHTWHLV